MKIFKSNDAKNAFYLGFLCALSYLAVYVARNTLSAVSPQMLLTDLYTTEYIGTISSSYFICYAIGQLVNGFIGNRIKAKYMISIGLLMAGICNIIFPFSQSLALNSVIYGISGFFLSMIYAPMTKIVSENTNPIYTPLFCLGYTFSSLLGSPAAGILATFFNWKPVFIIASAFLIGAAVLFFAVCAYFEKNGVVTYKKFDIQKSDKPKIKILIENEIIKFTLVSILTGVVRTSVLFWIPSYLAQHLGFSPEMAAAIFTVITLLHAVAPFVSMYIYTKTFKRNMNLTLFLMFGISALSFLLMFITKNPVMNIVFLTLAITGGDGASNMLWSVYCPGLRDTGMVSSATGYLDFVSYMAAALANVVFANAVSSIGWGNLILVWFALMVAGSAISIPLKKKVKAS